MEQESSSGIVSKRASLFLPRGCNKAPKNDDRGCERPSRPTHDPIPSFASQCSDSEYCVSLQTSIDQRL